ncbi:MAG: hypothetical protein COB23_01755 [Methylophaga sp.]|nr:MAG: hypothetical protein COB23_01755 [Methylophaga sp.]
MAEADRQLLFSQQDADTLIRVWQQGNRRWLDFNDGLIQSGILLDKPDTLPLVLNRAMLAGVMFVEQPKTVLLAGTGGGSTARYFSHHFPEVVGRAVEQSEAIVTIAKSYFDFPTKGNWKIITADIVNYVQQCQQKYDLIVIDIAEGQKTPEWLINTDFLAQCRSILTKYGHISINLLAKDADEFLCYLSSIRNAFDGMTVCLSLPDHRNIVTMAYNHQPLFSAEDMASRLPILDALWGLEFSDFYRQILKDNPEGSGVI